MKQIVAHKKIGVLQGILLVLGLVVLLVLINYVAIELLARYLGYTAASLGFWILGGFVAWQVLRIYITSFVYDLDTDVLRLSRKYGKRERFIDDIYLNNLLFVGSPEDAKKRYPQARKVSAVQAGTKAPVTAVVYQTSSGIRIALLQANAELKAKLVARVKAR